MQRSLMQMHVLAIAAPETMANVGWRKAVGRRRAWRHQRMATGIMARQAEIAAAARKIRLDRDTVPFLTPNSCRIGADIDNAPDRLVAGNERIAGDVICDKRAAILLDIAAAHPAGFDLKNSLRVAHRRDGPFLFDNACGRRLATSRAISIANPHRLNGIRCVRPNTCRARGTEPDCAAASP